MRQSQRTTGGRPRVVPQRTDDQNSLRAITDFVHGEQHPILQCKCPENALPCGNKLKCIIYSQKKTGQVERAWACPNRMDKATAVAWVLGDSSNPIVKDAQMIEKMICPSCATFIKEDAAKKMLEAQSVMERKELLSIKTVIGEYLCFPRITHNGILQLRAKIQRMKKNAESAAVSSSSSPSSLHSSELSDAMKMVQEARSSIPVDILDGRMGKVEELLSLEEKNSRPGGGVGGGGSGVSLSSSSNQTSTPITTMPPGMQFSDMYGDVQQTDRQFAVPYLPTSAEIETYKQSWLKYIEENMTPALDKAVVDEAAESIKHHDKQSPIDIATECADFVRVPQAPINRDVEGSNGVDDEANRDQFKSSKFAFDRPGLCHFSKPTVFEPPITCIESAALIWISKFMVQNGYTVPYQISFFEDLMDGDDAALKISNLMLGGIDKLTQSSSSNVSSDSIGLQQKTDYIEGSSSSLNGFETNRSNALALIQWLPLYFRRVFGYDFSILMTDIHKRRNVAIVPSWKRARSIKSHRNPSTSSSSSTLCHVAIQLHNMAPAEYGWILKNADYLLVEMTHESIENCPLLKQYQVVTPTDQPLDSLKDSLLPSQNSAWILVSKRKLMVALFSNGRFQQISDMQTLLIRINCLPYRDFSIRKTQLNRQLQDDLQTYTEQDELDAFMDLENDPIFIQKMQSINNAASKTSAAVGDTPAPSVITTDSSMMMDITSSETSCLAPLPSHPPTIQPSQSLQPQLPVFIKGESPIVHFSRHCGLCTPASQVDLLYQQEALTFDIHQLDDSNTDVFGDSNLCFENTWLKVNISNGNMGSDVHLITTAEKFITFALKHDLLIIV